MFSTRARQMVIKAVTAGAFVLAATVALYAVFLVAIGMPTAVIPERVPGQAGNVKEQIQYIPTLHALIGFAAAMMVVAGLGLHRLGIAWAGISLLFIYGAFFLFSVGGGVLLAAALLTVLLIPLTVFRRNN